MKNRSGRTRLSSDSGRENNLLRRPRVLISSLALLFTLVALPACLAQQLHSSGKRKIVAQAQPVYPALARKMNLTGTVRLLAIVSPGGTVIRSEVIGGNPLLAQSGADAVAKSRWEQAPQETKELVEIKFQPDPE